ncbi:uncharacterized protein TNCV_4433651 [Trichonephila clavipes]|nr:uncharacterized protein TNCV_4433651 [Trichonephila clavipes]
MQDHPWESCGSVVSPDDLCRSLICLHRLSGSSVFSSGREDLRCRRLMLVSCHLCDVITWWEQKLSALKIVVLSLSRPIFASAAAPDNSLNTSNSSLSNETSPAPTTSKFAALQSSDPLLESVPTSNSELSNASKVPQNVKMNSKNRRKRTKAQKAEIEIKMAKHKPRQSGPTELTTDDEDMIVYDVQTEELEPDPEDKFAMKECFISNPSEYMRVLTPTRIRKSRN